MDVKDGLMMTTVDPSGIVMKNSLGNETIIIDGSNGNVGINRTNPKEILDVNGNIRLYGKDVARYVNFYWNDNNGHLGNGHTYVNGLRFYNNEDTIDQTDSNLSSYGLAGEILHYHGEGADYSDGFDFRTYHAPENSGWDSTTSKMRILGNGNVGIGTTNPTAKLEVNGDIIATNTRLHYSSHSSYAGFSHKNNTGTGNYCLIHDATGSTFLNSSSGKHIRFRNNNVDSMILTDTGRLGIGTTNPSQKLHVVGNICATGNITESDRRIKTNITPINDGTALNKINQLESYEYNYIDPERKKSQKTIGFIAQEVKEVIPNAVTILEDIIPDEMRVLIDPQWDNLVLTIPDLDMSPENLTGKCKFYVSNDPSGNDEICKEIECDRDASGNKTNQFSFEQEYTNVFFYGKEVNDFHALDKNQIFALHHSAIQELSRKNDIKTTQIAELQAENAAKTTEIAELKNEISLIKQHLGI